MKPNGTFYKCAFNWNKLNDAQRKKVIQRFEEDYGDDFAAKAHYGNRYCGSPVKVGKKLSSLRKFGEYDLGYYCNDYLSYLFTIRTMHECVLHAPLVKEEKNDKNMTLYCTGIIVPSSGEELIEQSFFTEEEARNAVNEFNDIVGLNARSAGIIKQVIEKTFEAGELVFWKLHEWNPESESYEVSKDYPVFLNKKLAVDRAAHTLRMNAAFCIQWEVWKSAGYKAPESYDFTKPNEFTFAKKDMLVFEKSISQSGHLCETSYSSKVLSDKVDDEFIAWCEKEL